jgi:hypothetical protein
MPQENPMDEAFREIQKMLDLVEINLFTNMNREEVAALDKQLELLEKKYQEFIKESDKIFLKCGLTEEQMRMIENGENPQGIGLETSESYMKAKDLRDRLKQLEITAGSSPTLVAGDTKKNKGEVKSLSKSQHKKKYKRLGGSQDWKPL